MSTTVIWGSNALEPLLTCSIPSAITSFIFAWLSIFGSVSYVNIWLHFIFSEVLMIILSVCMCRYLPVPPKKSLKQLVSFHETWYECHATGRPANFWGGSRMQRLCMVINLSRSYRVCWSHLLNISAWKTTKKKVWHVRFNLLIGYIHIHRFHV
jgi:hypothetical protein